MMLPISLPQQTGSSGAFWLTVTTHCNPPFKKGQDWADILTVCFRFGQILSTRVILFKRIISLERIIQSESLQMNYKAKSVSNVVCLLFASGAFATSTFAQDLVYTPINPAFGGSSLNSSHLLATASAQRSATAIDANDGLGGDAGEDATPGQSDADLFVRQLEGRLLSALAGQVTDAIFGQSPQDSGLVTFGTTTVQFTRSLESITLLITDSLDGTVTEIIVPQLVTGNS